MSGSPDGEECEQELIIEGPGLRSWFPGKGYVEGKFRYAVTNHCLVLDEQYPLKVYTASNLKWSRAIPINGVVRNISFTNNETNETINTICPVE